VNVDLPNRSLLPAAAAKSTTGAEQDEVETNQLGAVLLMPRSLVKKELQSNDLNLDGDESIDFLAEAISGEHSRHVQQTTESECTALISVA